MLAGRLLAATLVATATPAMAADRIAARLGSTVAGADVIYAYGQTGPRLFVSTSCSASWPRIRVLLTTDAYDRRATVVRAAGDAGSADIVLCLR